MASRHRQWLPPPDRGHRNAGAPAPAGRDPAAPRTRPLFARRVRSPDPNLLPPLEGACSPWGKISQGFLPQTLSSSLCHVTGCVSVCTTIIHRPLPLSLSISSSLILKPPPCMSDGLVRRLFSSWGFSCRDLLLRIPVACWSVRSPASAGHQGLV